MGCRIWSFDLQYMMEFRPRCDPGILEFSFGHEAVGAIIWAAFKASQNSASTTPGVYVAIPRIVRDFGLVPGCQHFAKGAEFFWRRGPKTSKMLQNWALQTSRDFCKHRQIVQKGLPAFSANICRFGNCAKCCKKSARMRTFADRRAVRIHLQTYAAICRYSNRLQV